MTKLRSWLLLSVLLMLLGCATVPITGRSQLSIIKNSELIPMSFQQYQEILKTNELSENKNKIALIKKVGFKIQKAVEAYLKKEGQSEVLDDFKWEFNLIEDKTVNAWCMPGGKVAFYSGILPVCQGEQGVAVVMGHEIAHAIANHGRERMSQGMITNGLLASLSLATQNQSALTRDILLQSLGVGTQMGILKFSRKHEGEADRMGLVFMAIAGYNPEAAPKFWKRMAEISNGPEVPEWVSTHPSNERRIEDIKKHLPEALAYYEKK
ncbi:MAG: peptidase M48 [Flammeovirgaceae bacterium]|nr:peptidase M48 [Flammeovirgaceae bacterium]